MKQIHPCVAACGKIVGDKRLWLLACLLTIGGCSDDSSTSAKQNCGCKSDEVCVKDHCEKIGDDCHCDASFQKCYDKVCYDQRLCANPCPEDEICIDGACMYCTDDNQCYATGNESVYTARGVRPKKTVILILTVWPASVGVSM